MWDIFDDAKKHEGLLIELCITNSCASLMSTKTIQILSAL